MKEALAYYKKVDARLRRLCERKPSGKLQVPEAVHEQWKQAGKTRDELRALLEKNDFDKETQICFNYGTISQKQFSQDAFVTQVVKLIERKNEDTQEVKSGWFTPNQMKTELKWDPFLN